MLYNGASIFGCSGGGGGGGGGGAGSQFCCPLCMIALLEENPVSSGT